MVTVQSLLWPGADDDRWCCGEWIFNRNVSLCISLTSLPSLSFILFLSLSPFVSVFLFLSLCPSIYLRISFSQSPACPTSQLPQEPSSPQITQKATGTIWIVSGSSNQIQAPESTWHLMTLTWRHPMIPWRWKTARQMTPSSLGDSLELRVLPIWRPIPIRWGWSFRLITPCQEEDLILLTVVCTFPSFYFTT